MQGVIAEVWVVGSKSCKMGSMDNPHLPFITAKELGELTPEIPETYLPGFLPKGSIIELTAKIKAGKTTMISHMIRAVLEQEEFLGRTGSKTSVMYLTEERKPTFRANLERSGLLGYDNIHILHLNDVYSMDWPTIAGATAVAALDLGARLIIVDTLSRWAKIREDSENSAGAASTAIEPLEQIANEGFTVLVARHDKRGEAGEMGDWGRGSSGFGGAADVMLNLKRANQQGHSNRRILSCISRFDDLPERMVIDLRDGGYEVISEDDSEGIESASARVDVLAFLANRPAKIDQLALATLHSRSTIQRVLNDLERTSEIVKTKEGKAFVYQLAGQQTFFT